MNVETAPKINEITLTNESELASIKLTVYQGALGVGDKKNTDFVLFSLIGALKSKYGHELDHSLFKMAFMASNPIAFIVTVPAELSEYVMKLEPFVVPLANDKSYRIQPEVYYASSDKKKTDSFLWAHVIPAPGSTTSLYNMNKAVSEALNSVHMKINGSVRPLRAAAGSISTGNGFHVDFIIPDQALCDSASFHKLKGFSTGDGFADFQFSRGFCQAFQVCHKCLQVEKPDFRRCTCQHSKNPNGKRPASNNSSAKLAMLKKMNGI